METNLKLIGEPGPFFDIRGFLTLLIIGSCIAAIIVGIILYLTPHNG